MISLSNELRKKFKIGLEALGKSIRINKTTISEQDWPYIIAEIGLIRKFS